MSKISNDLKFKLFSDCIPVKGFKRGILYDLNRKLYEFIPNSMIDFFEVASGKSLEEIKIFYSTEHHSTIDEYLNFLTEKEFNFWMPETIANNFSPLNLDWEYPALITNAIIDINEDSEFDFIDVLQQLEKLGCMHVQIRSYCYKPIKFYEDLLTALTKSSYLSIEIITTYSDRDTDEEIDVFVKCFTRIKSIIFHSATTNKIFNNKGLYSMGNIAYTKQIIESSSDCHNNNSGYFNVMMDLFTESQKHHTYFNRKIAIDVAGNIKNCTSHTQFFGNVEINRIAKTITDPKFQKLWFVTKDETAVCSDCEFRHMCVDSRMPIKNDDDVWSHTIECKYNPYIAKWQNEEGYLPINETANVKEILSDEN